MIQSIFGVLEQWQVLQIQGPDAKDFLNRLTSANFKAIVAPQYSPATLLQPTGKVILYFKALALKEDMYLLLVPPGLDSSDISSSTSPLSPAETAYHALERLHFRENLKLTPQPHQWAYIRILCRSNESLQQLPASYSKLYGIAQAEYGTLKFITAEEAPILGFNEQRWSKSSWEQAAPFESDIGMLVPDHQIQEAIGALESIGFAQIKDFEPYRIYAGAPSVPQEINNHTLPLEASLDDAVHENKGCYPGQEVVERIRSMGQVPRKLALIKGKGKLPSPNSLVLSSQEANLTQSTEAGVLTSVSANPFGTGWIGLGLIKRRFVNPDASYFVEGESVELRFK